MTTRGNNRLESKKIFSAFPMPVEAVRDYTWRHTRQTPLDEDRAAWRGVQLIIRLVNRLSWERAYALGKWLGLVMYHLKIRKKVAMTNLTIVYGDTKDDAEKNRIYRASLINFGRVVINFMRLPFQDHRFWRRYCDFPWEAGLQKLLSRNRGLIILGCHLGMMDLAGGKIGMSGYPVAAVAKKIRNPIIDKWVVESRAAMNLGTIPHRRSIRRILNGLKRGESIILVMDQNMKRKESVFINWMGRPATVVPSAAFLAKKTGAPVAAGFLMQKGPKKFEIIFGEEVPWEPFPEDPEKELLINTQKQADAVQKLIYRYPELWFWIHRRWKVQPEGFQRPY